MRRKQETTILLRITGIQTRQQTIEILRQTQHRIHVRIQTQEIPADKQLTRNQIIAGQRTKKEEMRQRNKILLQIRIGKQTHNKTTINRIVKTVGLILLQPEIILHQAEIIRMRQTTQIIQVPETIQIRQQQINRILQTVRQAQVQTPEEDKN